VRKGATTSLLIRMGAWSLVLPVLKRVLPLPTLVRLMSRAGSEERSEEKERQIVRSARRVYRLRRRGSCLERSLLAYRYLSSTNAEPRLVIGARRGDGEVLAHAWVLVDGSPLYESSATLEPFSSVVEFAPDGQISSRQ
jgi:Transglutaminase-like superfamily